MITTIYSVLAAKRQHRAKVRVVSSRRGRLVSAFCAEHTAARAAGDFDRMATIEILMDVLGAA